jgi:hypothetical protein
VKVQPHDQLGAIPRAKPSLIVDKESVPATWTTLFASSSISAYQQIAPSPRKDGAQKNTRDALPIESAVLIASTLPVLFTVGSIRATITNLLTLKGFETIERLGFDV